MSRYLDVQKAWSYLSAGSMTYVDNLYEDYLQDPSSVPDDWRAAFDALPKNTDNGKEQPHRDLQAYFLNKASKPIAAPSDTITLENLQYQVADLVNAYRSYGHQEAKLDPLEMAHRHHVPSLDLSYHHLSQGDLSRPFFAGRYFDGARMPLKDIHQALRETYCGSIGIEYMHISNNEETAWIQQKMETVRGRPRYDADKKRALLKDLIAAEGLERYLGTRFVGQKRFSLEGGDALIPLMRELLDQGGQKNVKEFVIGMAHRGRLNVLVNVLGKEPDALFQEFEGKIEQVRSGDVKYHLGFSADIRTRTGASLHVALAFNPSHLEIIGPVIEGSARSRLRRYDDLEHKDTVVPIVIHGDAAFAGQGVVMETFNFSQARGYCTGGTVHIVINNQIGFTTSNPLDSRSTLYCTDVAKMVQAPVIHVNGDDPEAVLFAAQIAFEFRMKFKRDVVIDLVCYRRHGHNEADEPAITQPVMYQKIKATKPLRELYAQQLTKEALVTEKEVEQWAEDYRNKLDAGEMVVEVVQDHDERKKSNGWTPYTDGKWTESVETSISCEKLNELAKKLEWLPEGFEVHPVVKRLLNERAKMTAGELPLNWGYAEAMAYASLLDESYGVRLSGQDSGRGTFAHRHAVLYDAKTGESYIPLEKTVVDPKKPFDVIDSVLSEEAVLAFEYGYAAAEPTSLVLWEAQFGDFANGAQVVIDQFISSGEQKWGRLCGLVMLLPHGYEGQGPEHSSARLERYMQLCAQRNMQVCTPTTPAQIFHLLRRQMLRSFRRPLIVMTPKSLLRHKLAISSLKDLTDGKFYNVIPEVDDLDASKVNKIILCCGKVYYDLLQARRENKQTTAAIIRIEQLYPFPKKALQKELQKFPNAKTIVWCQEEPQNQGVWFASQHHMNECLTQGQLLRYAGRGFAAAPSVGSFSLHVQQQEALVKQALSDE